MDSNSGLGRGLGAGNITQDSNRNGLKTAKAKTGIRCNGKAQQSTVFNISTYHYSTIPCLTSRFMPIAAEAILAPLMI